MTEFIKSRTLRTIMIAGVLSTGAISGCLADPTPLAENHAEARAALQVEIPMAVGQMSSHDLPAATSVPISFVSELNAHQQLQYLPPQQRACVVEALTHLGMGPLLSPTTEPGTIATISGGPSLLQAECAGQMITVSLNTAAAGTNDGGDMTACIGVVVEFFGDLWDLLCREVVCLAMSGGRYWTCGCDGSDLADCANCPPGENPADYWQNWGDRDEPR